MTTTETVPAGTDPTPDPTEAFAERLFGGVLAALELGAVHLGARLGWYRALTDGPATPPELARRTGTDARYAREWLEQQAVAGVLTVDDVAADPDARRYTLPDGSAAVLVDELDPAHMTPFVQLALVFAGNAERLVDVYRTGGGLSWDEMGDGARAGQAGANRPWLMGSFVDDVLRPLPEVDTALRNGGRVADVGCGMGWSSIGIARGYPAARVDGFDLDRPSIERARQHAQESGVDDRVTFAAEDVAGVDPGAGGYDLVLAVECVHDMADPVAVLRSMRRLAGDGGTVLVVDERVAERFTAPGDEVERVMYAYSVLGCLPDGRSATPSAATGTVMRPATLEGYARGAGFTGIDVLPVENDFFRVYRLHG